MVGHHHESPLFHERDVLFDLGIDGVPSLFEGMFVEAALDKKLFTEFGSHRFRGTVPGAGLEGELHVYAGCHPVGDQGLHLPVGVDTVDVDAVLLKLCPDLPVAGGHKLIKLIGADKRAGAAGDVFPTVAHIDRGRHAGSDLVNGPADEIGHRIHDISKAIRRVEHQIDHILHTHPVADIAHHGAREYYDGEARAFRSSDILVEFAGDAIRADLQTFLEARPIVRRFEGPVHVVRHGFSVLVVLHEHAFTVPGHGVVLRFLDDLRLEGRMKLYLAGNR